MKVHEYEESLMKYSEYVVHKHIQLFVPPILLVVGTLGNVLSFFILIKNVRKASTYSYLCVLAFMDLLVLYIGLFRLWLGHVMLDVANKNNILCKLAVFLGYFSSDTSVWLIVAVTIERSIVVMFPLKAPRLCSVRNARACIGVIVIFFTIVNSHFLWSVQLWQFSFNHTIISRCQAKLNYTDLVEDVWPWVDAGIYSFVPLIIIIVLNSFIIKKIAKNTRNFLRQHSSITVKHGQLRHDGEMSRRVTIMLLTVSFTFLATTLPMNIVLIYTSLTGKVGDDVSPTMATRKLVDTVAEMLMYTNHSINFFLYCATGKKFRNQFKALIGYCFCRTVISSNFRGQSRRTTADSLKLCKMNSTKDRCVIAGNEGGHI